MPDYRPDGVPVATRRVQDADVRLDLSPVSLAGNAPPPREAELLASETATVESTAAAL